MKKLKRITVSIAIISFIATQGFSQNLPAKDDQKNSKEFQTTDKTSSGKFVDNNKDGVCDNYRVRVKNGQGKNFVDKNGDGVCDNRQNAGQKRGNPNGCGMGYQHRHGQGKGNCCGNGYGYRHRHGRD
jgi:hypothetical protein